VAIWFLLIFVGLPILEIALFVEVGGAIGLFPTLAIVLVTGVLGVMLVRRQGLRALDRARADMEAGRDPLDPIANGALILVAGILLILPGFFTDTLGLLLMIPPVRRLVIRRGGSRVTVRAATYVRPGRPPRPADVIDAEYERLDGDRPPAPGASGWTRRRP
jgi:UPF0716 protein FxsA